MGGRASRRAVTLPGWTRRGRKHRPDSRVRALPVVASAVRGAVVFFRAAPLAAANHALHGAHVARDAVAIQRNLEAMNRSAVSIASHANGVATFVEVVEERGGGQDRDRNGRSEWWPKHDK